MTGPHKILYVRTDRMGDVLMNLPALRTVRLNYPKAWITLMVDMAVAPLLEGHPDIDEIMPVVSGDLKSSRSARRDLIRKIRRIGYDLIVISNPSKFFHWLAFTSGIPLRVGWKRKWSFFLNRSLTDDKSKARRHEIENNLRLIQTLCAKPWDDRLELPLDERCREQMSAELTRLCAGKKVILVHTGTSRDDKRWPTERFSQLCRMIQDRQNEVIVFVGGVEENNICMDILKNLSRPAFSLCGATSWGQLRALMADSRVQALVSCDSGPVHVAWMSGKPVVALYARNVDGSNPTRWGPRDSHSRVIYKRMTDIESSEVMAQLEKILPS